jgi:hypothetical protein
MSDLAQYPDDEEEPADAIETAWQVEWGKYWRHGWVTAGSKWWPCEAPNESRRTVLSLERDLNDGRQLSPVTPKETP